VHEAPAADAEIAGISNAETARAARIPVVRRRLLGPHPIFIFDPPRIPCLSRRQPANVFRRAAVQLTI
jgi:hypothetical protein